MIMFNYEIWRMLYAVCCILYEVWWVMYDVYFVMYAAYCMLYADIWRMMLIVLSTLWWYVTYDNRCKANIMDLKKINPEIR